MDRTWVVVCDSSRARILSYGTKAEPWEQVEEIDNPAGRARGGDLVTDRPGRVRQSGTGAKAGIAPHTDPTHVERHRFAARLAELLQHGFDLRNFSSLVLVAPPALLGDLRKELSDPVRRCVSTEIGKDYAGLVLRDLHPVLAPQIDGE
ncbi:MAG: host attachment protein [Planctomycetota bacterium]|jgi:protein required for attachment to host cells